MKKTYQSLKDKSKEIDSAYQKIEQSLSQSKETIAADIEDAKGDYIEWLNEQASLRNERRYLKEQVEQRQRFSTKSESELATVKQLLESGEQGLSLEKNVLESTKQQLDEQKKCVTHASSIRRRSKGSVI